MQPPLIGNGCSIPGTRPENHQVMRSIHFLQDRYDADLGEVQGSPLLPEERSQQGDEGTLGPLRNQNLQMDLVYALMSNSERIMNGKAKSKESYLASEESHPHPVGQLLHSTLLGSLVLEPDLKTHMALIGFVQCTCNIYRTLTLLSSVDTDSDIGIQRQKVGHCSNFLNNTDTGMDTSQILTQALLSDMRLPWITCNSNTDTNTQIQIHKY